MLHVTAVLDGSEEAFQIGVGKQLRQPALFAAPAQAQLFAGLLRDIEEIVVPHQYRNNLKASLTDSESGRK